MMLGLIWNGNIGNSQVNLICAKNQHGVVMYLTINSSTGSYDWAHPREKQVNVSIRVHGAGGQKVDLLFNDLSYEITEPDPTQAISVAIWYIDECIRKTWFWTGRKNAEDVKQFLVDNEKELTKGTIKRRIETLVKRSADIQSQIGNLNYTLIGMDDGEDNDPEGDSQG